MIALIDSDIVAYRCAASCQKQEVVTEPEGIALARVDELVNRILTETKSQGYGLFLTGADNFRYKYNPDYKANRKDTPRPVYLEACREYLVTEWGAIVSEGCEADDLLAINSTDNTIICSIDKDLLQVPGKHYNFVKQEFTTVTEKQGLFNFYWQFIMGDKADNIFGFDGLARSVVPKKLNSLYEEMQFVSQMGTELDLFDIVRDKYDDDERLLINGICLWMQRVPNQIWQFPK